MRKIRLLITEKGLEVLKAFAEENYLGKKANNRYASLVPLIFVGIIYLILVAIFTKIFALIVKKFNYYE